MKITKSKLKKIIQEMINQEVTLKEIHPTVQDPLELMQAALGKLDEIDQLISDVGVHRELEQTLKGHLATAGKYLEAASSSLMPTENSVGDF
jgi:hypothetical protein